MGIFVGGNLRLNVTYGIRHDKKWAKRDWKEGYYSSETSVVSDSARGNGRCRTLYKMRNRVIGDEWSTRRNMIVSYWGNDWLMQGSSPVT